MIKDFERLVKFFLSLILFSHKFVINDEFVFYKNNNKSKTKQNNRSRQPL